jgi:hypothetical protein
MTIGWYRLGGDRTGTRNWPNAQRLPTKECLSASWNQRHVHDPEPRHAPEAGVHESSKLRWYTKTSRPSPSSASGC